MTESTYALEAKAEEDRKRLHKTVAELRSTLSDTLDVKKNARQHLGIACGVAALVGLGTGYSLMGMFIPGKRGTKWRP
jgi:hypothetical protein